MRILLICERISGHGGWYTYARLLREGLLKNGHEVTVCSMRGADGDHGLLPSPLDTLGKPWVIPGAAVRLLRLVKEIRPDIIHVTVEPYALLAALLPKEWMKKTVVTVHGSYGIRVLRGWGRFLARRAFENAGGLVAVSDFTKNALGLARRVDVVKNSVALAPWTPRSAKNAVHQILLVGGVKPRKGILEALRGCAAYREKFGSDFFFTIVGTCDERDAYVQSVRALIQDLELADKVTLAGSVPDSALAALYARADAYVMPSGSGHNTFEGYGIAFLEANAHGVPVIGPVTSGAAEAIVEGKTGYRVKVDDPEEIAERLHRILDQQTISAHDCRAWAEEHAVEKKTREMEAVYERVIGEARAR